MAATTTFVVLFVFTQEHFNGSKEMLNYTPENGVVTTLKHGVYGGVGATMGMVPTKEHWKILPFFWRLSWSSTGMSFGQGSSRPGIARGQRPKIR